MASYIPPPENREGHVPRVPQQIAPMNPLVCGLVDTYKQISTPRCKQLRYSIRLSYFGFGCAFGIHAI